MKQIIKNVLSDVYTEVTEGFRYALEEYKLHKKLFHTIFGTLGVYVFIYVYYSVIEYILVNFLTN